MNDVAHRWLRRVIRRASYSRPDDGVVYIGVFLSSMDKLKLISKYGQSHADLHAHHMTVWFFGGTAKPDYSKLPWGRDIPMKVIGHAEDAKGQAVVVEPPSKLRPVGNIAHLTVSTAPGVAPAYSGDLLRRGWDKDRGPTIKGKLGWWGEDQKIHLTPPEE